MPLYLEGRCNIISCLVKIWLKGIIKKNVSPRCLLKIDLQKAYDTISWAFLEKILRLYGFDP